MRRIIGCMLMAKMAELGIGRCAVSRLETSFQLRAYSKNLKYVLRK